MAWDSGLEGVHRAVAADDGTSLHVLAGPGTGKTFALMRRVARLLEVGVEPERIVAVSFTRTAARDLREQLTTLGVAGSDGYELPPFIRSASLYLASKRYLR